MPTTPKHDDAPTLRHWIIAPVALATLIFGVPALAELLTTALLP